VLDDPAVMDRATVALIPEGSFDKGNSPILNDALFTPASPQLWAALLRRGLAESPDGALPPHLIEFYQRHLDDFAPADRPRGVAAIARTMADADPAAAITWISQLDATTTGPAHRTITATWALSDSLAASQWVQSLPPGMARDEATVGLVHTVAQTAPEEAWEWASSIGQTPLRAETTESIIHRLSADRSSEAQTLIDASPLAEAEKASLRALLPLH
jgi:hypothetical protein